MLLYYYFQGTTSPQNQNSTKLSRHPFAIFVECGGQSTNVADGMIQCAIAHFYTCILGTRLFARTKATPNSLRFLWIKHFGNCILPYAYCVPKYISAAEWNRQLSSWVRLVCRFWRGHTCRGRKPHHLRFMHTKNNFQYVRFFFFQRNSGLVSGHQTKPNFKCQKVKCTPWPNRTPWGWIHTRNERAWVTYC